MRPRGPPGLAADVPAPEQAGLRTEGFLLEQQGKLAEAARKYWEAGEPAIAANSTSWPPRPTR